MKLSTELPKSQFVRCNKRLCRGTGHCVTGLGLYFCTDLDEGEEGRLLGGRKSDLLRRGHD